MQLIKPNWPAPQHIQAFTTLRTGGVSEAPFDSFNLATHVEDKLKYVELNRNLLIQQIPVMENMFWLNQVHGNRIINLDHLVTDLKADAVFTSKINQPCGVLTADCLPVLITNTQGTKVAAVHAGWRGLLTGVIEASIEAINEAPENLLVWLGPAISQVVFELGPEVYQQFIEKSPEYKAFFAENKKNKRFHLNMYNLATYVLHTRNIMQVYRSEYCTFSDEKLFYSARKKAKTGRMLTSIVILDQ